MTSVAAFRQFGSFASQAVRQRASVPIASRREWVWTLSDGQKGPGRKKPGLAVDVDENNQVEKAMRILRKKATNEKYEEKWRETYHVKKGEKRRQELKKSKFKVFKAEFRDRMRWILQRRARGF